VTATVVVTLEVTKPVLPRKTVEVKVVGAGWMYLVTVCVPKLQCAVEVGGTKTMVAVEVRVVSMAGVCVSTNIHVDRGLWVR
jgi:hypothetical protein